MHSDAELKQLSENETRQQLIVLIKYARTSVREQNTRCCDPQVRSSFNISSRCESYLPRLHYSDVYTEHSVFLAVLRHQVGFGAVSGLSIRYVTSCYTGRLAGAPQLYIRLARSKL